MLCCESVTIDKSHIKGKLINYIMANSPEPLKIKYVY